MTLVAFALTVGSFVFAQRRAARDSEELAKGYVPVALRLGQLRATQATLSTLVDGIPDERNPVSTRLLLEMLFGVRRAKFAETRATVAQGLVPLASPETLAVATAMVRDLDAVEELLAADRRSFEQLFGAIDTSNKEAVNRVLVSLGATEHEADRRLRLVSESVARSMEELSAAAHKREQRSVVVLLALSSLTLIVGVGVSLHARRLLGPLAGVTERARAVAAGDLTARDVSPGDDEISQLAGAFEQMVTEVGRAQSQALSNERLAAIGKMAAHVTHEIRNPLSSIGLNIDLLEEEMASDAPPDEARALLASIKREVGRLEQLSDEYLRVARLPSPRLDDDDLVETVRETVEFARPEVDRSGCSVALTVATDPPTALFDAAQIRQALLNLLRNAREAMPDGGAIDVTVETRDGAAVVLVEDRGVGIPDEIRARVFDPFFSTKGEGTGLGLAITRHILGAHGGAIACEARPDGGTSFRLMLPLRPSSGGTDRTPG